MSASLVGSEMCIRDRETSSELLRTTPRLPAVPAREPRTNSENGAERCPVSYTHLTLPTICSV
eukprot:7917940-Alexandrium_andersonii.AAC.1